MPHPYMYGNMRNMHPATSLHCYRPSSPTSPLPPTTIVLRGPSPYRTTYSSPNPVRSPEQDWVCTPPHHYPRGRNWGPIPAWSAMPIRILTNTAPIRSVERMRGDL